MIPLKKNLRVVLVICLSIALLTVSILWYIGVLTDNFRVVTPGRFYRAGQMDEDKLREVVSAYQIHTIVNLRGLNKGAWYATEERAAKDLKVQYVNIFDLNQNRLPPPQALEDLLQIFHKGPYPMLIHCKAGADRTGLASVIYRMVIEKAPFDSALNEQLTWQYGHFPVGEVRAMDDFFELYRENGKDKNFESWIIEDYPALYYQWQMDRCKSSVHVDPGS